MKNRFIKTHRKLLLIALNCLMLLLFLLTEMGFGQTSTFTSSGTWTCPGGVTSITVECWGAGGGGGYGGGTNRYGGGGGGGGAYTTNTSVVVVPGTTYTITVGTGGAGGLSTSVNGGDGLITTVTFGSTTVSANGGFGGKSYSNGGTGGAGGNGGTWAGGTGGTGNTTGSGGGGEGSGTTVNGNNGNIPNGGTGTDGGDGGNGSTGMSDFGTGGTITGGGGGGGTKGSNGGAGAGGRIKLTYSCPSEVTASAGPDQNLATCANTATLAGNTPNYGTGTWTVVSGTATITSPNAPSSTVTGLAIGASATLRWTISNGDCLPSTSDDVTITTFAGAGCWNYCASTGTTSTPGHVSRVQFNSIDRSSGWDGGYYDGTGLSTTVYQGLPYNLTLTRFANAAYNLYTAAWIDFNNDGDFADAGENVIPSTLSSVAGDVANTQSVSIPYTAITGPTRLRVMMKYNAAITGPCENNVYQETEDYTVVIGECPTISISQQPTNQLMCASQNINFVYNLTSAAACTYTWRYNGVPVVNGTPAGAIYTGASTSTLNISGAIAAGTYASYTCYVTSFCRNVTSNAVSLTVSASAPPATPADPLSATYGCTVQLTASGSAPAGETWFWQGMSCGTTTALGSGPTYTATMAGTYYLRAQNNTSGCFSSGCGDVLAPVLDVPSIVSTPTSTYGCNASSVTFSVVATGAGLTYQWQENAVNMSNGGVYSGVTTENLIISNPGGLNGKQYRCVVTGTCGNVTSASVTLNVLASGLSGPKTVGSGGDYTTMKAAFDAINTNGLAGNLELRVISDITENTEAVLNQWQDCSGNTGYTVTIYPTGATRTISGNIASSLITLNGPDQVTINGKLDQTGAANSLIFSNSNSTGSTFKLINDATYNTIKYCSFSGASSSFTKGVIFFNTASTSGNSNNTITYCNIYGAASNGLYAEGTTGKENKNNTISYCNFYNVSTSSPFISGLDMEGGNTKWIIDGNSFYLTASAPDISYWPLLVNCPNGNEFIISNNYIGGQSANCGGSKLTITNTGYILTLYAIVVTASTSGVSKITNNTIRNINFTTYPHSSGTVRFLAISSTGRIDVNDNIIGDASTGSIAITINANDVYSGGITGIIKSGDGTVNNNRIGSFTIAGTIAAQLLFNAIQITGTLINDVVISGNIIGHESTANSIQSTTAATPAITFGGIYFGTAGSYQTTVSNNIVANIKLGCTTSLPFFIGLSNQATGGTQTIIGNTIKDISTASINTTNADMPCFAGIINNNSTTGGINISNNYVHSITSTGNAAIFLYGIKGYNASGTNYINGNIIHSFSTTSITAVQKGITLNSGTCILANNMIRLGIDKNGISVATNTAIFGIENATTSATSVYFNSVYVGGGGVTGATSTMAYYRSGTGTSNIRNNIFVNARSGGGSHFSYYLTGILNLISDYNIYSDGAAAVLAFAGGNRTTIAAIRTGTTQDANSLVVNPLFINPTGNSTAFDLHLQATSPAIGIGIAGTGILIDYDNQQRKTGAAPSGPCIGADERVTAPYGTNSYGIYSPDGINGEVVDCEITAVGGTPGGIGYQIANPDDAHWANVGISGYQVITAQNYSCLNTNIDFTTTDATPNWLMGNGSSPTVGFTTPLNDIQYSTLGRKDILESVKIFKDFINMTMEKPDEGSILGAPSGAGCPTTYSYTSSVAGSPGYTYSWSCVVPGGCTATITSPLSSSTDITFVNLTGVNQVFLLQLDITTECCGPLNRVLRYITIYPAPIAPTAASPYVLCTGGSQTISVTAPDPAYSYNWFSASTGGTLLGSGTSYTVTPVLTGTTSYWVEATNSYGCASARTEVKITGNDATPPTVANQQTCGAGDITFVVSAPVAGYTYNWFSGSCGGTLLQSNTSTSYTATIAATTTFYVQAIPIGCGASTCSAPVATLAVAADPLVWLGAVAGVNNWFNTANWTGGCLPTCANNVSIPNTANDPDIGFNAVANAACKNIDLQNGAVLTFSSNNAQLDICGNMIHAGQVTTGNLGIVKFIGTTPQSYSKTGLGDFHNVALNNTAASPSLTLSNGNLELDNTGTFQFVSGKVITGAQQLVIKNPVITSVTGHSIIGYVAGNLTRYVNSTGSYDLPLGNINAYELATIDISSTTGLAYLTTYFGNPSDAFGTGLPATDNTVLFDLLLNAGGINATTGNANGGVWTITPNAGTANYQLTLYGRNYDNGGTTHTIVKRITAGPGAWAFAGTFGANSIGGNLVTAARSAYSGFSQFAIAKSDAALPVKLLSFDANCVNDIANIEWATATEQNNDYFTLERSADASFWDFVATIDGAGNSNAILHYTYADEFVLSGTTYYRLLQTDFDGRKYLYGPVSVHCENNTPPSIYYFPNPFTSDLLVNVENLNADKASIVIYNMLGEIIMVTDVSNINEQNHRFQLDLSHLATGMYTIRFVTEGFESINKVVKYY